MIGRHMIAFYLAGMPMTAAYLWRLNRPREPGAWIAYAAFIIGWPLLAMFALVAVCLPRRERGE